MARWRTNFGGVMPVDAQFPCESMAGDECFVLGVAEFEVEWGVCFWSRFIDSDGLDEYQE